MQTVLIGAVESSAAALEAMIGVGHPPGLVVGLPQARSARHSDFVDLGARAGDHGVPVWETVNINDAATLERLADLAPDIVFVIGWSQICGPEFLALPRIGAVGFHPSALPQHRGRAVIPWTILLGIPETGASLFWLADGLDDGDLLVQERFEVAGDETSRTLYDKHCAALRRLLTTVLPQLAAGEIPRRPQDHSQATYCARRTAADGIIDWGQPARDVWTLIRAAGRPYPGAFSFYAGRRVTMWEADLVGPAPHFGIPGQIQELTDHGILVQCGDGEHVSIRRFEIEGEAEETNPNRFKRHERFGVDWLRVIAPRGAG